MTIPTIPTTWTPRRSARYIAILVILAATIGYPVACGKSVSSCTSATTLMLHRFDAINITQATELTKADYPVYYQIRSGETELISMKLDVENIR